GHVPSGSSGRPSQPQLSPIRYEVRAHCDPDSRKHFGLKVLISSSVGMHMTHRMGNAGTAILIGAFATVTFVVAMNGVADAADNCLSGPKGAAPKGSHWYYRIDHAT